MALEAGLVPMQEPETHLVMEAPGGLAHVTAQCKDGKATQIRVRNVASFVDRLDVRVEVPDLGTVTGDIAFGGDSFIIVDAHRLGFAIAPDEARELADTGIAITNAANEQLGFHHPANPDWQHISFRQLAAPVFEEAGTRQHSLDPTDPWPQGYILSDTWPHIR